MTPSSLAQFGTSFASGTLRIDDPLVCVRDNEPQPAAYRRPSWTRHPLREPPPP